MCIAISSKPLVMFKFILALLIGACASASAGKLQQAPCVDIFDEITKILDASNSNMNSRKVTPTVGGFQRDLEMSLFRMPLEVQNGLLTNLSSLTTADYAAVECWTDHTRTLNGNFKYDTLTLTYDSMKTRFLFWEVSGKLSFSWKEPTVWINMTKGTDFCDLHDFTFSEPSGIDYEVSVHDSPLMGSFVSKVLHLFLTHDGTITTQLLCSVKETALSVMEKYFKSDFCTKTYPGPWFHGGTGN